jgi:hypothetical protein
MGSIINISIDLNKIDKSRIKQHSNGAKYYAMTVDTKREPDQFGNTHTVYDSPTKEEREAKTPKNYLGSGKEFVFGGQQAAQATQQQQTPPASAPPAPMTPPEDISDLLF